MGPAARQAAPPTSSCRAGALPVAQADVRPHAPTCAAGRRRRHRLPSSWCCSSRGRRGSARAAKGQAAARLRVLDVGCRLASDGSGKALVLLRCRVAKAARPPAAAQALLDARRRKGAGCRHPGTLAASLGPACYRCRRRCSAATAAAAAAESPTEASRSPRAAGGGALAPRSSASSAAATLGAEARRRRGDERRQEWHRVRHHSVFGQRHRIGRASRRRRDSE